MGGKQSADKLCSYSASFFFDWLVDVSGIKKLVSSSQVAAPSLDSKSKYKQHSNLRANSYKNQIVHLNNN